MYVVACSSSNLSFIIITSLNQRLYDLLRDQRFSYGRMAAHQIPGIALSANNGRRLLALRLGSCPWLGLTSGIAASSPECLCTWPACRAASQIQTTLHLATRCPGVAAIRAACWPLLAQQWGLLWNALLAADTSAARPRGPGRPLSGDWASLSPLTRWRLLLGECGVLEPSATASRDLRTAWTQFMAQALLFWTEIARWCRLSRHENPP